MRTLGPALDQKNAESLPGPPILLELDSLTQSLASSIRVSAARFGRPGRRYHTLRRGTDLLVCLLVAPIAIVLGLMVALAIKLDDRGPVFFVQSRTGQHGRRFRIYKFRTMWPDAMARKSDLSSQSFVAWPDFKVLDDPRMTPVGAVLRKCFLDELPQLINVLKGDMTLVGPRPTSFSPTTYLLWHTERLEVKPGLTGLWQITRSTDAGASFDDRARADINYLRARSSARDIRIILRTFFGCCLRARGV
jgi:lipopolysaccharide/colanic/teichoic acid biosynthesis glycosyltransferase